MSKTSKKKGGKKAKATAGTKGKYVYYFGDGKADGNGTMKALLGGKGANLAEMTRIGLPVPCGFTISTEVCDPEDIYEDGTGYGDASTDPVDSFTAIADDGSTTMSIEGNILEDDSVDWYLIETSDDASADASAGIDYYSFEVELLDVKK